MKGWRVIFRACLAIIAILTALACGLILAFGAGASSGQDAGFEYASALEQTGQNTIAGSADDNGDYVSFRTLLANEQANGPTRIDVSRLSEDLVNIYATEVRGLKLSLGTDGIAPVMLSLVRNDSSSVGVSISAVDVHDLLPKLKKYGFEITATASEHHLVEGLLPVDQLLNVTALADDGLLGVTGIALPMTGAGTVLNEGDFTLAAKRARASMPPGVDGTGVTIGVLSDSYNNLGGEAAGISSGNLPSGLVFRRDLPSGGSDEGRAMVEVVHDIAPGSPKAFATAFTGQAGFAQNIRDLAAPVGSGGAGASVITDDVFYFAEPMFQDGIIAQAVSDVVANNNVAYFSLAGNLQDQSYENAAPTWTTTTIPVISASPAKYLEFSPGVFTQNIGLAGQTFIGDLEWSDPFYTASGVQSDVDFFLLNSTATSIISQSVANNIATQVPVEQVSVNGSGTAKLVIRLSSGVDPTRIKWVNYGANNFGPVTIQFATNSPTVIPHSGVTNALSVGAAPFYDQRIKESYTSKGPFTVLFDRLGNPISTTVRAKPDILSTDGVSNTFFGSNFGIGSRQFFGTSCAAPNAAGVGALVRQANPGFSPGQVYSRMISTADPNVSGGVNFVGAGLIDAFTAVVGPTVVGATPLNDGFESGVNDQRWSQFADGDGRVDVSTANSPATGSDHLILDGDLPGGFGTPGLAEATVHVNLAGKPTAQLAFAAKKFSTETIVAMPTSFTGHNNSTGVSFSVDGTTWFRLEPLSSATTAYQTFTFDLIAAAAGAGVSLSSDTRIKFQRYSTNSGQAPTFGIAIDDVSITTPAGPATHFSITAPPNVTAGVPFDFTVTALDASNSVATGYTGTVHFTSTDYSPADLPLNVTLVNGVGTFGARLFKGGIQTIDAYDLANFSISGKSNNINVGAGQAYSFRITAPANVMPGVPFNFTAAAVDAYNNPGAFGTGTVVFSSTDGLATLPANTILTNGVGTFSATLRTGGGWAITAHDISLPISGSSNNINVASIHFAVSAPSTTTVGIPFSFTVTAQDLFNNTLTGYAGTVHFTSTDGSATLPADSTLTNGVGTFNATLRSPGTQTITATDTNASTVTGRSNNINVSSPVPMKKSPFDFDGDGKTDISVFRGSSGTWFLNRSQAGFAAIQFGASSDVITPADFTGDGKADIAVWRPATGTWYVMRSEDSTFYAFGFGQTGDLPVAADFDGDGRADMGVYRPSVGTWFVQRSTAGFLGMQFGTSEDKPVVADFDGDGKADISLFRPSTGTWYRINSSNGAVVGAQFGSMGDIPLVMDVDGDGKANYAVYRPGDNTWYMARTTGLPSQNFDAVQFGTTGDIPVPGDYDGDGKTDIGIFRPSSGTWFIMRSTAGFTAVQFGIDGDKPGPTAFMY